MTPGNAALRFDRVSKSFRYFPSPVARLRELFSPFGKTRHVPVPVLEDVSVTIGRGEMVAIVGANGVGKSTLLHLAAGLIEPTSGTVSAHGRVTSVLDLGGSFAPDLTGRENARFFHRVVAGANGDLAARLDAIEEFAAIGEYFDRPVRTYSAGMFVRLAFATVTCGQPDILLIDEVLAVGDARFQQKCHRRIQELRERGTTIVLVTHVVHALPALCDRVIVLERGRIAFDGDPARGVERYYQLFFGDDGRAALPSSGGERRTGQGGAVITGAFASRDGRTEANGFAPGESVRVVFDVQFERAVEAPELGVACVTTEGLRLYTTTTGMQGETPRPAAAGERRRVEIELTLNVAVRDLFVDLSVFEVRSGTVEVLDACFSALHLTLNVPPHCLGFTDLSAVFRTMR